MRQRLEYGLYRAATAVFGLLPEPVVRKTGEWLGWLASFVSKDKFDLVRRNLARVVGEEAATNSRVRTMFRSYGRYWAEVFWVTADKRSALLEHSDIIGAHHISDAVASGRGIVLALPHLGNWEAAGPAASSLGAPVLAVAEALPNERIVAWFTAVRADLGIDVVLAEPGRGTTGKLLARLREGGTIALLADRDVTGSGIETRFFGELTTIPAGPAALADRTGAALIPVGCYFKRGRGHRFDVRAPIEAPDIEDKAARLAEFTSRYTSVLEDLIRNAPEQWHLFQPNWPSDRNFPAEAES